MIHKKQEEEKRDICAKDRLERQRKPEQGGAIEIKEKECFMIGVIKR